MLGSMLYTVLKDKHKLVLILQDKQQLSILEHAYGGTEKHKVIIFNIKNLFQDYIEGFSDAHIGPRMAELIDVVGEVDVIVNCASIVKPHLLENVAETLFINAGLPHLFSRHFKNKLIHLSTDCVFDGLTGAPYEEDSPVSPTDLYGFSRSIGEPSKHSIVIRTSTIGPEIHGSSSLITWVRKQEGQTIKGFTRYLWNGITSKQFAICIDQIVNHRDQYPDHGLFHIFGSDVSKFDMITAIAKKYHVNVKIIPDSINSLDRRLRTVKELNKQLSIPSFNDMLNDL